MSLTREGSSAMEKHSQTGCEICQAILTPRLGIPRIPELTRQEKSFEITESKLEPATTPSPSVALRLWGCRESRTPQVCADRPETSRAAWLDPALAE